MRRIGIAATLELCTTGATIDAEEALRLRLVNRIDPDPVARAVATIETIAGMGPDAVAAAKAVIYAGADLALGEANRCEQAAFGALFGRPEQAEGMAAFLEKRPAAFLGRR